MSTAEIAKAAQTLSYLRDRLVRAANVGQRALYGSSNRARAKALRELVAALDDATDTLHPFAFYTDSGTERLLGLSVAMSYARGGDARSAGEALTAMFDSKGEAA